MNALMRGSPRQHSPEIEAFLEWALIATAIISICIAALA